MSRSGEEMILELATLLGTDVVKTAAKKKEKEEKEEKDEKKEDKFEKFEKKDEKAEKKDEKADKKDEKADKKDEKADKKEKKEKKDKKAVLMTVIQDLVKLANELDAAGADEASSLVDDALQVILNNVEKKKIAEAGSFEEDDDPTEWMGEEGPATGREEGAGSRLDPTLEPFKGDEPEGLAPGDVGYGDMEGSTLTEDKIDKLLRNPQFRSMIQERLRGLSG